MKNRNGYTDSIMVENEGVCALCGRRNQKLDRHEPWGGANRQKSKELGLWVNLHRACHEEAHRDAETGRQLRADAQRAAMLRYGWTREEWIRRFGKSELSQDDCARIILTEKVSPSGEVLSRRGESSQRRCSPLENPGDCAGFRVILDGPELPY